MKTVLYAILLVSCAAFAEERREHGAHVHGNMLMSIAFDGTQGEIHMDGAADSVIGFEHKATTAADKKTQKQALETLEKGEAFVRFDKSLNCKFESGHAKVVPEGHHSDVEADFKIKCDKSPVGTKVTIDFTKSFPRLKKLDVQVLADQLQKSSTLEKFPAEMELK